MQQKLGKLLVCLPTYLAVDVPRFVESKQHALCQLAIE